MTIAERELAIGYGKLLGGIAALDSASKLFETGGFTSLSSPLSNVVVLCNALADAVQRYLHATTDWDGQQWESGIPAKQTKRRSKEK